MEFRYFVTLSENLNFNQQYRYSIAFVCYNLYTLIKRLCILVLKWCFVFISIKNDDLKYFSLSNVIIMYQYYIQVGIPIRYHMIWLLENVRVLIRKIWYRRQSNCRMLENMSASTRVVDCIEYSYSIYTFYLIKLSYYYPRNCVVL